MDLNSALDENHIIEEVDEFLFNMPNEYSLGHCVAQDMRMSAGIATKFKSVFGRIGELMDQKPRVGSVAFLNENNRFIYYLVSKDLSHHKPTYNSITLAITELRNLIVKHNVKKLAIPRIGCGLDKLDWSRVKSIIEELFLGLGCMIKVCHFTHDMGKENETHYIPHPNVFRIYQNINEVEKRKFEKLNFILYAQNTSRMYWNQSFQSVNEKHDFKSQYYEDCQVNLEVGQVLHYETSEAHIHVVVTNNDTEDHLSYQNLEIGIIKIKNGIKGNQWHPTFIIQKIYDPYSERLINHKITSLLSSIFMDLVPCVIHEIGRLESNNKY